ncbi:hypothetical protein KUTeg_021301 [Tegillarca granosa]|uniref:C-type lectin domain-containing protein n=1 Tax=Tegillarca granosa TaxID=220873 RepID=A0ABQ9EAD9_TEGGR|nr:hypothetical protein KUTeg_021301 [Tegillarca granosa]
MWIFLLLVLSPFTVNSFGNFGQGCESQLLLGFLLGNTLDGFSAGSLFGNPSCPTGFMTLQGCSKNDCYFFSTEARTWEEARIDCINRGAHLTIVKNANENTAIKTQLGTINPAVAHWNALNDIHTEGTFRWDPFTKALQSGAFTDFTANMGGNNATSDCVAFNQTAFTWATLPCNSTQRYVCERKASKQFSCNAH